MKRPLVSVIIIARNEEANIDGCILSVLEETKGGDSEVILVDSDSTDKTVEIAKKYPIEIFQIRSPKFLSPSAGRYVGTIQSQGKYLLFLDGDMILIKGFIQRAVAELENGTAAVAGRLIWIKSEEKIMPRQYGQYGIKYVECLGGAAIYRKDVLESVGTFNPFIRGQEEKELGYRIIAEKHRIAMIDWPMVYHIGKEATKSEIDEKASYYSGLGQIWRKYLFDKLSVDLIKLQHKVLLEILMMFGAIFVGLVLLIFGQWKIPAIILGFLVAGSLSIIIIKGPIKYARYIRSRLQIFKNLLKGFIEGIQDPKTYLSKVKLQRLK